MAELIPRIPIRSRGCRRKGGGRGGFGKGMHGAWRCGPKKNAVNDSPPMGSYPQFIKIDAVIHRAREALAQKPDSKELKENLDELLAIRADFVAQLEALRKE